MELHGRWMGSGRRTVRIARPECTVAGSTKSVVGFVNHGGCCSSYKSSLKITLHWQLRVTQVRVTTHANVKRIRAGTTAIILKLRICITRELRT